VWIESGQRDRCAPWNAAPAGTGDGRPLPGREAAGRRGMTSGTVPGSDQVTLNRFVLIWSLVLVLVVLLFVDCAELTA
jgi:hypothetical protein